MLQVSRKTDEKVGANTGGSRNVIEFDNAGFNYGTRTIFSGVSHKLDTGSFHFLTGPSGAGKTTILRHCYLDLMPTSGSVAIFDTAAGSMSRDAVADTRRRIGVVHQNCQFLDHLSVADNVALPLLVSGTEGAARMAEVSDLLHWVGLSHRAEAFPPELSGGERQRAALARAVILSPDMIIADEPTGNIDWEMGQKIMTLLVELNRLGKTILIASHDLQLIRAVGSEVSARILRLKGGQLLAAGSEL